MRSDRLARRANKNMPLLVSGAVTALVAELAQPQPTGSAGADVMWSVLAGVAVAVIVGRAVVAVRPGLKQGARVGLTVGVAGAMFFVQLPGPFGLETALVGLALVALAVLGQVKRPKNSRRWRTRTKRRVAAGVAVAAAGFAVAVLLSVSAALKMRTALVDAADLATAGAQDLRDLELERGTNKLRQSVARLDDFDGLMGTMGGRLMGLVPVVGHQRHFAEAVVKQVRDLTARAAGLVRLVPIEQLSLRSGRLDTERLQGLEQPVTDMVAVAQTLNTTVTAPSGWVMSGLTGRFDDLAAGATRYAGTFDSILQFVQGSEWTTGGTGPRTYVVNVVSPVGMSGAGGAVVASGVMKMERGQVSLSFAPERPVDAAGLAGRSLGQIVDYPRAAENVWGIYNASQGTEVSGVVHMDVRALADLIGLVGEVRVSVDGAKKTLTSANAYGAMAKGVDPTALATAVSKKLMAADPLSLVQLAKVWGPAVANGNVKIWVTDYTASELVRKMHADGAIGEPGSIADVGVFTSDVNTGPRFAKAANGSGWNVGRTVKYDATVGTDGTTSATLNVTVSEGGTTPRTVSTQVFTLLQCQASVDGTAVMMASGRQAAWLVHSVQVSVPAKGSTTVRFTCTGSTKEQGVDLGTPRVRGQVTAKGDSWTVNVKGPRGTLASAGILNSNVWTSVGTPLGTK